MILMSNQTTEMKWENFKMLVKKTSLHWLITYIHWFENYCKNVPQVINRKSYSAKTHQRTIWRWNSLFFMLHRFYKVKNCILKSLIEVGSIVSFDEYELNMICYLVETLEPVKLAFVFCSCDATLLSTDRIIFLCSTTWVVVTLLCDLKNHYPVWWTSGGLMYHVCRSISIKVIKDMMNLIWTRS